MDKNLFQERKWYNLFIELKSKLKQGKEKEVITAVTINIMPIMDKIHPTEVTGLVIKCSRCMEDENAIEFLNNAQQKLAESKLFSDEHRDSITLMELEKSERFVKLGKLEGIEKKIYEWKAIDMDNSMGRRYFYVCYLFYEKIKNNEEAYRALSTYLSLKGTTGDVSKFPDLCNKLVRYALLSKEVYNFTSLALNPIMEFLEDKNLRSIFTAFQHGNYTFLEENENLLEKYFGSEKKYLKEKCYLVALINLCFSKEESFLTFEEIETKLKIDSNVVIYILLKALGLNLIRGSIDGEKRVINFTHVMPRVLSKEELIEIKAKFTKWRMRVENVIEVMNIK